MIKVRLQIGDGEILDTLEEYGFVYISSDTLFSPPLKPMENTTYPEQSGENVHTKAVSDAFDYKVTFLVKANGHLDNVNRRISYFNSLLYEQDGEVKSFKEVSFYNDYKRVKIVGIPSLISIGEGFWRDLRGCQHDVVKVDWMIRVNKPELCDFNLQ